MTPLPPSQVPLVDQRLHPRKPASTAAKIFPSGLDCVILDATPRGLRLLLPAVVSLPDGFIVVEWANGDAHEGEAVWARGNEVGVNIQRSCDLRDRVPHAFAEARAAWSVGSSLEVRSTPVSDAKSNHWLATSDL